MKKLVLLVFVLVGLMTVGLVYATTLPWGIGVMPQTVTYSPFLVLNGDIQSANCASFVIGYEPSRKTSCILIQYGYSSSTYLWSFENENPKLYNDIKNIIYNHLEGRKNISSFYNGYGRLCFGYVTNSDGLNIIQSVGVQYTTNQ
jgi:hypothetical protein